METAVRSVQTSRGQRRRWTAEQKLVVLPKVSLEAEPRTQPDSTRNGWLTTRNDLSQIRWGSTLAGAIRMIPVKTSQEMHCRRLDRSRNRRLRGRT